MLDRHLEIRIDEPLSRNAAEAHDYLRADYSHLLPQITDTGLLLLGLRVSVFGRAALDHVGNVYFTSVEVDCGKKFVEQLSRSANKWFALQILVFSRALADKHDSRAVASHAENHVVARFCKLAFFTAKTFLPKLFKGHFSTAFFVIFTILSHFFQILNGYDLKKVEFSVKIIVRY